MKKKIRYIFLVVIVCALGYAVGYYYIENTSIVAKDNDNIDLLEETVTISDNKVILELFDANLFDNVYIEDTMSYKVNIKEANSRAINVVAYTRDDVYQLALKVVEPKYDLIVVRDTEGYIRYEEYQGDFPTGAYASFVFDDDGALLQARFRKGVIYDAVESKMISYEDAFELAQNAICEKYGEDVTIEGTADDYEYEIYYRPDSQGLCYMINNVRGYLNSDEKALEEEVEFFVAVDMEGMFVEVASTLGY